MLHEPLASAAPAPADAPEGAPGDAPGLAADVALIQGLPAVPRLLSACLAASGMGIVAVARVTEAAWVACAVLDRMGFGLGPGGALPVETTLCGTRVRDARAPVVIEHASAERDWCDHPTPRLYRYESHVSVPILLPSGEFWGTLVAIDPAPRPVRAPDTVATFTLFAELLGLQIDAALRLRASEAEVGRAREEAARRERFVAVLGHDLRNPIAAIDAGVRMLGREPLSPGAGRVLGLMRGAVGRMAGLVDDVLDFARGRMGGGIPRAPVEADLGAVLGQILDELREVHPDRPIEARIGPLGLVRCDPLRIGQMASNLVANAFAHGAPGRPIRVEARREAGALVIEVANGGEPIPPAILDELFEPFVRAGGGEGLGLGLYIAAEIARAHDGTLEAATGPEETRITFRMPLRAEAAAA